MQKKLTRSRSNRIIAGVMGGISEHFNVDANIIRLGYLFLLLVTGVFPGVILYIAAIVIMPEAPLITPSEPIVVEKADDAGTV
ncbi:MAG: PspC domain-containing protein [Patescibacteria group bacterium]